MMMHIPRSTLALLMASLSFALLAPLAVAKDKKVDDLKKKLEKKVTLGRGIEQNTPLKDAYEFLADRFDLKIVVDKKAFEAAGINNVEETPVQLKKQNNVGLGMILQALLDQVKGVRATYRIDKDHILIVPDKMKK